MIKQSYNKNPLTAGEAIRGQGGKTGRCFDGIKRAAVRGDDQFNCSCFSKSIPSFFIFLYKVVRLIPSIAAVF